MVLFSRKLIYYGGMYGRVRYRHPVKCIAGLWSPVSQRRVHYYPLGLICLIVNFFFFFYLSPTSQTVPSKYATAHRGVAEFVFN
jgi:hypothetical protein